MATTIKVSPEIRDKVNAYARQDGSTAAEVIARLLEHRERREKLQELAKNLEQADGSYWEEFDAWESMAAVPHD